MADDCAVVRFSREPSSQGARIENLKPSVDEKLPPPGEFGLFNAACVAVSAATYVADLALASVLLYMYVSGGCGVYFAVTLTFVLLPALLMTAFNFRWYIVDNDDPSVGRTTLSRWAIRVIFLLLQISPLLRYFDTLIYGIRSKVAGEGARALYYRRMLDEDTNGALLRLFHCFLHSAPQALLQLVILLKDFEKGGDENIIQAWTVIIGLVSTAWAITSYHRSVRFSREDKNKMEWSGVVICFCWQLMIAVSRVLALSLLASIYEAWMGVVIALHWGMMSVWLALGQQQTACSNRCEELLSAALGLAYIVAFISPRDGPTRYVYLAYYLICFMENTAALVVWCVMNKTASNLVLYYGAPAAQVLSFLLGIVFLLVYYRYYHPSSPRHSKVPAMSESCTLEFERPSYSRSYSHRTHS